MLELNDTEKKRIK